MTEISRFADEAMWPAPPIPDDFPRVSLIHMTHMPLQVMAAAAELYGGEVVSDPSKISRETAEHWFDEMSKTRLQAPLEFIDLHFLLDGVTRGFTHQLVRQRTAVYVQESLRFAVKDGENFEVTVPPSLSGLREDDPRSVVYTDTVTEIGLAYQRLINAGIPAEDARFIIPTGILTRVHYKTNLRNLAEHAGNRLCTQAQFEWRLVWAKMIKAVRDRPFALRFGEAEQDAWQYETIADMFRPICFYTGKCEFMGEHDRYCSIRDRMNAKEYDKVASHEWLADPAAARRPSE